MKELIEKSKNIASEVYVNIGKIEEMESLKEAVQEGRVSILLPDGELADLKGIDDNGAVKSCIFDCIDKRINDAVVFLKVLTGAQDEPKGREPLVAEQTEHEAEKIAPVIDEKKETSAECTKEMLERDWNEGLSVKEMMEKYGKAKSTVYKLLKEYGLTKSATKEKPEAEPAPVAEVPKKTKKASKAKEPQKVEEPKEKKKTVGKSGMTLADYVEANRAEVIALYTKGPFSLKQLAVEYSCDRKELHEVLARKGLLKTQV